MQADNLRQQAEDVRRTVIAKRDVLGRAASGRRHSAHNVIRFLVGPQGGDHRAEARLSDFDPRARPRQVQ